MSECNVQELLNSASCFTCLTEEQNLAIQTELLCRVYTGGGVIEGYTPGSVIFAGSDGTAEEDNANFFYNDTTNALRIGPTATLLSSTPQIGVESNRVLTGGSASRQVAGQFHLDLGAGAWISPLGVYLNVTTRAGATGSAITGMEAAVFNYGTFTSDIIGVNLAAVSAAGSSGRDLIGGLFQAISIDGAYRDLIAGYFANTVTAGTFTNSYAGRFVGESGGTITNRYGIHVTLNHAAAIGELIKLAATPTGDALRITSSADVVLTKITAAGLVQVPDGTAAIPSVAPLSDTDNGLYFASNTVGISASGAARLIVTTTQGGACVFINSGLSIGASATVTDVFLVRDAANILAQRNGTAAQAHRIYNTFTDASNYERGALGFGLFSSVNEFSIGTEKAGTGSARQMNFATDGTRRFSITSAGHLVGYIDNTYDIGASGANRPRTIYAGTAIYAPSSGVLGWAGSSYLAAGSDGVIKLSNNAGTDFGRLQFGGTTAGFPALRRSAGGLEARTASDSGYTTFQAILKTDTNATAGAVVATHTLQIQDATGTTYRVLCAP